MNESLAKLADIAVIAKNQFQVFMESLAFNFKRLIKIADQKPSFATSRQA